VTRAIVLILLVFLTCRDTANGACRPRFVSAVRPFASCETSNQYYVAATRDFGLAHYQHAYACYREGRYPAALHELESLRTTDPRLLIGAQLARAAVFYQLGRRKEARSLLSAAQRNEAQYAGVTTSELRAPTGAEPALLRHESRAFTEFLPSALGFELVQKEDTFLKRGVFAAAHENYCNAERSFVHSIEFERSSTARWLNGSTAFMLGDRKVAVSSWFDIAFEPENPGNQTFNRVEWSAVSLIIATAFT